MNNILLYFIIYSVFFYLACDHLILLFNFITFLLKLYFLIFEFFFFVFIMVLFYF